MRVKCVTLSPSDGTELLLIVCRPIPQECPLRGTAWVDMGDGGLTAGKALTVSLVVSRDSY